MNNNKQSKANSPKWVRISSFIFYPFYAWFGLMIIGVLIFPKSVFTDIVMKPLELLLNESSETWEGCWEGIVEGNTSCFQTTYEELTFKERRDLELESDVYLIDNNSPYQVTREVECENSIDAIPPYMMDLRVYKDSSGFFFTWQDKKGYLNVDGVGSIEFEDKVDSLFLQSQFFVRVDIDSEVLKFSSSLTVYSFDELQFISQSVGRFTKKSSPCEDDIRFRNLKY